MNWIKCNDELPPLKEDGNSEHVLVTDGVDISTGYFILDAFGDYRCYNDWDLTPTHWMPLPPLPNSKN